jgi:hypothetical protein
MYEWLSNIFHKSADVKTSDAALDEPVVKEKYFDYGYTRVLVRYEPDLGRLTFERSAIVPWRDTSSDTPVVQKNKLVINQLRIEDAPDSDFLKALENAAFALVQTGGNFDITYNSLMR